MDDKGAPIAYTVLADDTPVYTKDGVKLGKVKRMLADTEADIFDGLIVDTRDGDRFVAAPNVAELYKAGVVLAPSSDEAQHLPEPSPSPAVLEPTADDIA